MRFVFWGAGRCFSAYFGIFRHISTDKYEFARRMGRRRQRRARFLYFFEPERILSICKKGGKSGLFAFGIKIAPDFKRRRRKTKTRKNSGKSVKNASKTVKKSAKKRSKTKRKFLAWLFKHIKVRKLKIKAVIGTGDAADLGFDMRHYQCVAFCCGGGCLQTAGYWNRLFRRV